jgi:hypothetical protein
MLQRGDHILDSFQPVIQIVEPAIDQIDQDFLELLHLRRICILAHHHFTMVLMHQSQDFRIGRLSVIIVIFVTPMIKSIALTIEII